MHKVTDHHYTTSTNVMEVVTFVWKYQHLVPICNWMKMCKIEMSLVSQVQSAVSATLSSRGKKKKRQIGKHL